MGRSLKDNQINFQYAIFQGKKTKNKQKNKDRYLTPIGIPLLQSKVLWDTAFWFCFQVWQESVFSDFLIKLKICSLYILHTQKWLHSRKVKKKNHQQQKTEQHFGNYKNRTFPIQQDKSLKVMNDWTTTMPAIFTVPALLPEAEIGENI